MVNSVLTNYNSLVALQNLQNTQMQLSQVQTQISTGLKISTAKDDAATWAVATTMNSSIANLKQVSSNLGESDSVVGLGVTTANSLTTLLSAIKANITNAQNPANNASQVQDAINQQLAQLDTTISSASFQGVNLLNTAGTTNFLGSVNTASDGTSTPSYITVQTHDLSRATGELGVLNGLSVESTGDQLFNTSSTASVQPTAAQAAAQAALSTTGSTFTLGTASTTPSNTNGLNSTANTANALTLAYTDSTGKAQSLNLTETPATGTNTDLATSLNADTKFSSLFHATAGTGTDIVITAATRAEQTGSFQIGALSVNPAAASATAGLTSTQATSTLTFQDGQSLSSGAQFSFAYTQGSGTAEKTGKVILQVGAGTTGTVNSYDATTGTVVVNVNQANVSGTGLKGSDIAGELSKALTGFTFPGGVTTTNPFQLNTTAAAQGHFDVVPSATGGSTGNNTLTISSADGTDNFTIQTPQTDYATLLSKVDAATKSVETAASALGSAQSRIESQQTFVTTLTNTLTAGVSGLVDADMSAESARLSALQVQQQLGTQALSIANSTPQSILSLFK